jgi:hypothetical protein
MLPETHPDSIAHGGEYTAPSRSGNVMGRNAKVAGAHRRLRWFYFVAASSWGFLCGVVGLAGALAARGHVIGIDDPTFLLLLVPPLAIAAVGAMVAATAYCEARRRSK